MKKKQNNTPRRKRSNRQQRLVLAAEWMKSLTGKNIVKGYADWFGVDLLCAVAELRLLGQDISEEHEMKVRNSIDDRKTQTQKAIEKRAELKRQDEYIEEWDSEFEYIAGHTSNGAPYGIRRGEMQDM